MTNKITLESVGRSLFNLLLRALLLLMGLVFLLSLLVAALLLVLFWGVRAVWARLTGRPVQPFAFTVIRRAQWERFYRPGAARAKERDVIDVEARRVRDD